MILFTRIIIVLTFISEGMTQNDYERWPRIGIILTNCLKNTTKPVIKTEKDIKIMIEKIPRFVVNHLTAENQFIFISLINATISTLNKIDDYLVRSHNYENIFKTKLFLRFRDRAVNLNFEYSDHKPYGKLYNMFCTERIWKINKQKFDRVAYELLLNMQKYSIVENNTNMDYDYCPILVPSLKLRKMVIYYKYFGEHCSI